MTIRYTVFSLTDSTLWTNQLVVFALFVRIVDEQTNNNFHPFRVWGTGIKLPVGTEIQGTL